jgi:uncharacterized protein YqjF (DUF2071 family)
MPSFEMEWRDVFFASYPVDPDVVRPHLPDSLTVDTFEGNAYLSVVPFVITDIRPKGLPGAVGLTTPELNLRTYVSSGGKRGVYFFNLDADDLLGVLGARVFNHLPYYYADMSYDRGPPTRFESRRRTPGARSMAFATTYGPDGDPYQPDPGTVEHFLVERYCYFTENGDGDIEYADIEHEPWTLRPGTWTVEENTIFAANGFEPPESDPVLSYSRGLPVSATPNRRWQG